jgi:SAM-dependent methyltransferase
METGQLRTFWETIAEDTRWGRYLTAIERQALLTAHALAEVPGVVLEIGCEGGRWLQLLSQMGWQCIGTDVEPPLVATCQQRLPAARCVLVHPQETTLPCETATLDLLLCFEVIPVMESEWLGAEAQRTLRAGGLFVGVFFNRHSWRALVVRTRTTFNSRVGGDKSQTMYNRSYAQWKKMLHHHSFSIVEERGCCWLPFSRTSNSPFIPVCARMEQRLGLQTLTRLSPWIVFIAQKRSI